MSLLPEAEMEMRCLKPPNRRCRMTSLRIAEFLLRGPNLVAIDSIKTLSKHVIMQYELSYLILDTLSLRSPIFFWTFAHLLRYMCVAMCKDLPHPQVSSLDEMGTARCAWRDIYMALYGDVW